MDAQTPPYTERYRPRFHYSPASGWMNDPNGLVYYQGEYHLFYQYHPADIVWGPMHWGHVVSSDLVHWTPLPIALYPDDIGTIFSGTVVVDAENTSGLVPGGGLIAVYSYDNQAQGASYSTDGGRSWQRYTGNPILPALRQDFRDPKIIWHEATQRWVMAIAAGNTFMFFTSTNLLQWDFASEFTGGYLGGVWEVPDLFPLEINGTTKWVFIVSVNPTAPAGGSGTRYFIGEFDGQTFTDDYRDETLWFDYGADNYAGTTWNNEPQGRRIFIGWMSNWDYANKTPTSTWRGAMTIPRQLSLRQTSAGVRLAQTPIETLTALRQPIGTWQDLSITGEMILEGVQGQQLEIVVEFALGTATMVGVDVFVSETERTRIAYDVNAAQLTFSRPQSGISAFNPSFSAPLQVENQRLRLHLLIDKSSVEVFADDGLLSMTSQVFPDGGIGVKLFASGGEARLVSLQAYALRSIW